MVTIPIRTDDNDVIIYFSLRDTSHSHFELLPIMKGSFMLIDAQQHGNPPDSLTYLIDMKGVRQAFFSTPREYYCSLQ